MARTMGSSCSICGARWMQDWEEPDECPNGCYDMEDDDDDDDEEEE